MSAEKTTTKKTTSGATARALSNAAESSTDANLVDVASVDVIWDLTLPERLDRASASVLASARERIKVHSVQRLSFERTRRLEPAGLEALRLFCKQAYEQNASVRLERLLPEAAAVLALCGFATLCLLLPASEESADE